MASQVTTQTQENVECDVCQSPVYFFCRRCLVKLCDSCVPVHLRIKSEIGHDVVCFASKEDDDACLCNSHPEKKCSVYCKTCDLPICLVCVSIKHKSHELSELSDKIKELLTAIGGENDRLQLFRQEFETLLDHITKRLSSLSSYYNKRKEEVTAQGKEWHNSIKKHVEILHKELDNLEEENGDILHKQKRYFEELIGKIDGMNRESMNLQKSKNWIKMQKLLQAITNQIPNEKFEQYTLPTFHECKYDEDFLKEHFGYIEKIKEKNISLEPKEENSGCSMSVLKSMKCSIMEKLVVSSVIDTGFPDNVKNNKKLYVMAATGSKEVWMVGERGKLKLFDLQGNLRRTVTIPCDCEYVCMYSDNVTFSDVLGKAVKKISEDGTVSTMFRTGDWKPYGLTSAASGDLLVCLHKDDQSKVVRYSDAGTVFQEIQYDSYCQPLYLNARYIAENMNGDIVVTDFTRKVVTAVDRFGIFRYTYSGTNNDSEFVSIATDSNGHVIITDFSGDKIHMLDRDGQFLRHIIPEGGIKRPHAVCMINCDEMIVGECLTGLAKRIKFLQYSFCSIQ